MRIKEEVPYQMKFFSAVTATPERRQSLLGFVVTVVLLTLFLASGIRDDVSLDNLQTRDKSAWSALLIIVAMTGAWAFALPASVFFFVTPLLFPPLLATAIICIGATAGTSAGYLAARFIGGPWVERFRHYRVTSFLRRHSSFATLFAVRVFPSSPHGWINYAAGLLKLPYVPFLAATMLGISIKAFLYSIAIAGSAGASSIGEALNWQTVSALTTLALLSLGGHILKQRWEREEN
jgi:uncharacterized membrane protein YdjX (TVP38/TMEM64 family)